ncbi:glycosyltransferase family 4 protein [Microbacterium testaceum]|uniref:glycosyltransferase family 4 protein n=1 Tax=Microbacterium testaceum TaxID=2033 RepID=UPI0027D9116B|nr:glycosyltransferase family 4 protein [Microbacterium testaceum]
MIYSQLPPPFHGSAVMTSSLYRALQQSGLPVLMLDRRFSRTSSDVGKASLDKVLRVPSLLVRAWRLPRQSRAIFFLTNRPGSFLIDLLVLGVFRLKRVNVVHYVHTFGYERLAQRSMLFRHLVRWALTSAEEVVSLSELHAKDLTLAGASSTIVIPNATESLDLGLARQTSPARVIFFASISREKGALDFVEVARAVGDILPDVRFEMFGAVSDESIRAVLSEAASQLSNFYLMGEVREFEAKMVAMSGASALLYPSTYKFEAQPLAIIEAMSAGVPTVAYPAGAIPEMLSTESGVLVSSTDEMILSTCAILRADTSSAPDRARRAYSERYSMPAFTRKWLEVLRDLKA